MKKVLLIAVLAIVAIGASAQTGIRVWYGANISGNEVDGSKSKFNALNIGVDYTKPFGDTAFDWAAGVSYQTKGAKNANEKWNPGFLQVEANGSWNFVKDDEIKVGLFTGPYVGFLVNKDDAENAKSVDFGWQGGIMGEYNKISLKVGYEYGFLDVFKDAGDSCKPYQIFFRVGYTF